MPDTNFDTPVLFIIFNRPDCTQQVFERIRSVRPKKLFVAADGPRADRPGEDELCCKVREIVGQVDWDCAVKTFFQGTNLGCKKAVSGAINWFFENVEEGIIIEDDCLPDVTFFNYCKDLLIKYRDDARVMVISGTNLQFGKRRNNYSYYFSKHLHVWGWASWRRAWKHYDVNINLWPEIRDGGWLQDLFDDKKKVEYWESIFERVYKGKIDTWDYQWGLACWAQSGLIILPNINLISNIGFGQEATHTTGEHKVANLKTEAMHFPLNHPTHKLKDCRADSFTDKLMYSTGRKSLVERAIKKCSGVYSRIYVNKSRT